MAEASYTDEVHTHKGAFAGLHSHAGGALHWHDEFGEHTAEELVGDEAALRQLDYRMHNVELTTVGIDIGSSTTHLMFSRVFLQRIGEDAASRFVVVGREILWKSPIILTPYKDDDTIDVAVLSRFVDEAYSAARARRNDVDSGAVILTGEALKRKNARAIGEMFASDVGRFVCASAGHHLEAVLAANGSGTVARSRRDKQTLLNVDIGGGTTKFALVREGQILATAAVAVGARLLVKDADRRLTRVEGPAQQVADRLGIRLTLGETLSPEDETRIVEAWRDVLVALIERQPVDELAAALLLTEPLPAEIVPDAVTFSGGVSEYIFFRERSDFGDLGIPLARTLRQALSNGAISLPALIDPNLGIRATAIGASLFTVQAGSNVYVTREGMLPLRNVPVMAPVLDLSGEVTAAAVAQAVRDALARSDMEEGEQPLALFFAWGEQPADARVQTIAAGIRAALPKTIEQGVALVLLADQTIGKPLGVALKEELGAPGDLVAMDGLRVAEFDFIDLDRLVHPIEVIPVAIKSLLFAGGLDRGSVRQALLAAARGGA